MAYKVNISSTAVKFITGLDYETGQRIKKGTEQLQKDPFLSRSGTDIKMLKGVKKGEDLYRLRVGNYRILYMVENSTVMITKIFHRGKGYEWL
ncbi:MAG: type II toxin-antitoxin system RelE/ParE family toxin [archaeon]